MKSHRAPRTAMTRSLLLAVGAALAACRPGPTPLRPLVLVTIDTLRADHVGAYGYPRETTPFLDRLAAQGVLFEHAVTASSNTAPAHASLMTSLQPFQHGLLKNGQGLVGENHTLAELLSEAGYDSAAFTSVSFLAEICQGFGLVDAQWRSGDLTVDAAITWLDARQDASAPFFLWVHLYDPHVLKGPREKLQADAERLRRASGEERRQFVEYLRTRGVQPDFYPSEESLFERYDIYDAGIRFADRQIERLYHRVEAEHPGSRWVVTADHGEGLGNHGYSEHDKYLYDEQVLVPLIIAGVEGPPRRVEEMVRLVDVYPTVTQWIGRSSGRRGPPLQGYPLFSNGPRPQELAPRFSFSQRRPKDRGPRQRSWADGDVFSLRTADLKYIFSSIGNDELYDLTADPFELENRIAHDPQRSAAFRRRLLEYVEQARRQSTLPPASENEAHEAELKALGYL